MNKNRVALYLRLSEEDKDKKTKEELSESIKNQELMLKEYTKINKWNIVGIYSDEDWSGADNTRPEFNKMIKECEKGNIDIVLVKSQSRFARDSELIEKYLHNKFIEWNVKFQSVIERIDNTKLETKKTSQILGLTDEWYLEDTSLNIRKVLKLKREKGKFTGSFAPYGYKKDIKDKNHLIIDPVASLVVKKIFNYYINGQSLYKIASSLTKENIPSPLEYKKLNGSKLNIVNSDSYYLNTINKSGNYIIKNEYKNISKSLKEIIIIHTFISENKECLKDFNISLYRNNTNNIKFYYSLLTTKELLKHKKDIFKYLVEIKDNSVFDSSNSIITIINKLDKNENIDYEFKFKLKENKSHKNYIYKTYSFNGIDVSYEIRKECNWSEQTIKKILNDEVYLGNLIQFKTTTVSYKNKKIIYNKENDKIRVNNTHEKIIDNKTWSIAHKRLNENHKSCKNGKINNFSSICFCEECNSKFTLRGTSKDGNKELICSDRRNKWTNCSNNTCIKENILNKIITDKFNILIKKYFNLNILNNLYKKEKNYENNDSLLIEKNIIQNELKGKNNYLKNLYDNLNNELITKEEYINIKKIQNEKYQNLEKRLIYIDKTLNKKEKLLSNELFKKYKSIKEIDRNLINNFIKKIIIGNYDSLTNTRKIKIVWNFKN